MKKLDARLRLLLEASETPATGLLADRISEGVAVESKGGGVSVEVLVAVEEGDAAITALKAAGFRLDFLVEGARCIAGGSIDLDRLPAIEALDEVVEVEASRRLERHLDVSRVETRAAAVQADPGGPRGQGVIVGIIDSGIDFTHPDFLAADGSSRVLSLWDQGADPPGGANPVPFGREFTKADLDAALASADPFAAVPSRDVNGHGTITSGIAAGGGQASGGQYTGIAPRRASSWSPTNWRMTSRSGPRSGPSPPTITSPARPRPSASRRRSIRARG